jgi:predicted transcriptional regulator of viral defense system
LAVARRAAEQWGVLSLEELLACGLNRKAVGVRVNGGRLHRLHRGVYAVGHANPPLEGRWLAAVKASGPSAVLSHLSAAALWGIVEGRERRPDVTLRGPGTRLVPGVRLHRAALDADDRGRCAGIPVTSPARTLVDLAAVASPQALRRASATRKRCGS